MTALSCSPKLWAGGGILLLSASLAHAQSSVTLYGIVDAGFQYASQTPNAKNQNAGATYAFSTSGNGPSVFGLRGTEDLGGGYKATFQLESGISLANGGFAGSNGNLWGREAWVGLEGDLGKFRLGVQYSPFYLALFDSDPRHFSTFGSSNSIYGQNLGVTGAINSNAIVYQSPNIHGFEGSAMFAPGGVAGDFQAGKQWSGSIKYDNGNLLLNAAIYDGNAGGAATPVPTNTAFLGRTLGMAYRFGGVTARFSFVNYKVSGGFNNNVYGGGLDWYPTPAVNVNGGVWVTSDRNDTANHSVMGAVGVNYSLSKRTSLYAQFGVVDNHGAMNTGLSLATHSILYEVPGTSYGANVGIRQSF